MSFQNQNTLPVSCPRCKSQVSYADIIVNDFDDTTIKLGNASRVVLEPCFCNATSRDADFQCMVKAVERFNTGQLLTMKVMA